MTTARDAFYAMKQRSAAARAAGLTVDELLAAESGLTLDEFTERRRNWRDLSCNVFCTACQWHHHIDDDCPTEFPPAYMEE